MSAQSYFIHGMDCADCAVKIEKGVRQLQGVEFVELNFPGNLLKVQGTASEESVKQRVEALGYTVLPSSQVKTVPKKPMHTLAGFFPYLLSRSETRLALMGGSLLGFSLLLELAGIPHGWAAVLQVIALGIAGYPIARAGLANLWINHDFNIDLLMSIAAVGAVVIGDTSEAAMLIFLFAIAEALEGYTTDRARQVLGELSDLAPTRAVRLRGGREENVSVDQLVIGDLLLVYPGERIPMDGNITQGTSEVNQAPITGESMPVEKRPGDEVFAGTVNGSGSLQVQVTHLVKDNTLSRIIQLVAEAQSVRAPSQRFIDQFARGYTPVMVGVAILVAALPPLIWGQPFLNPADGTYGWFYRALAMLVIACPCALVLSTPVTILSAITAAARKGVLIKGGAFLEVLAVVKLFAFDKTGTLTYGRPVVIQVHSVDCVNERECASCDDVLALASALERRSTHPLARAVVTAARQRGLDEVYAPAMDVVLLNGMGVEGRVNGQIATIGSHRLFHAEHEISPQVCAWVDAAEAAGETAMLVCDGERVRGFITVADEVRPESAAVITELHAAGRRTAMLSGDNPAAAQAVADPLGIDLVQAGLLPEGKVQAVKTLEAHYGRVAMVGDGINDAPALAAASLGIAMGGAGSAQALESADIVLMADDLNQLPVALRLSIFARRLIKENIWISLVTKVIFIILALSGVTSMWMAVVGDMGVSLVVTLNGLRPIRYGRK